MLIHLERPRYREYIIRDILETAMSQPVTVTHINLHVGLTSGQTKDYLQYLLGKGLIRKIAAPHPGRYLYKSTSRGIRFLEMINTISGLLQPDSESGARNDVIAK